MILLRWPLIDPLSRRPGRAPGIRRIGQDVLELRQAARNDVTTHPKTEQGTVDVVEICVSSLVVEDDHQVKIAAWPGPSLGPTAEEIDPERLQRLSESTKNGLKGLLLGREGAAVRRCCLHEEELIKSDLYGWVGSRCRWAEEGGIATVIRRKAVLGPCLTIHTVDVYNIDVLNTFYRRGVLGAACLSRRRLGRAILLGKRKELGLESKPVLVGGSEFKDMAVVAISDWSLNRSSDSPSEEDHVVPRRSLEFRPTCAEAPRGVKL